MNKHIPFLFTFAGIAASAQSVAQENTKPNIIWLMAEDMGQDLECYGMPAVKTPVLNKLASEGIKYTNACCSNPISSPSRSAMMTGVHQTEINAHNHRSNRDLPLPDGVKPITCYLRKAGYTCVLGNKQVKGKGRKTDCNFKHTALGAYDGIHTFGLFDKYDEFTRDDQPFFAQIQLNVTHRGDWWKEIRANSKHPVDVNRVVLPPYMPDHPKIREQWATYLDQVEYMDNEVGLILEELEQKGMMENTVIFFIADNGRCEVRGKGYLYEPGIKIPMIAWGKGITPQVVTDLVSTLDISATVLALAGAEMPACLSGKSLFDTTEEPREYFYAARDDWDEIKECMRSVSTVRYSYIKNYMPQLPWDQHQVYLDFHRPAIHVMRVLKAAGRLDKNTSLFMAGRKPAEELYDIQNDPHQLVNLAGDPRYRAVLQDMRGKMNRWQATHRDCGLEDRNARKPGKEKETVRDWLIKTHPEEWKKLQAGEICDSYARWTKEKNKLEK